MKATLPSCSYKSHYNCISHGATMAESCRISEGLTVWHVGLAKLSWWGMREAKAVLQILSPSPPLFAGFLLVCLEENRIWLLHGPEKGQVFAGRRRRWVAGDWSQGAPAGPGATGLRACLAGRGRLHFPSFLTARLSAQGSWPQPRLFSWRTKPFLFFFFFSLDLAVGKELETICTRKYRLKNECVSPSPLGRAALTAEVRQQCVRRPASCQWRQNE